MPSEIILKTHEELEKEREFVGSALEKLDKLKFWRSHFVNKKFQPAFSDFNWERWKEIPFLTKKDFIDIGFATLWDDFENSAGGDAYKYKYILRTTSGTTKSTEPVLLINEIPQFFLAPQRSLRITGSFSHNLRGLLVAISGSKRNGGKCHQFTLLPNQLNASAKYAIADFNADFIFAFPTHLVNFSSIFLDDEFSLISSVKVMALTGDFVSKPQLDNLLKFYGKQGVNSISLDSQYSSVEAGMIGASCFHLQQEEGVNVYHPVESAIIEIVDVNEDGYGEVVCTRFSDRDDALFSLLRYRTGDIAKASFKKCKCGAFWSFALAGRKDFDYIKCGGAVIMRSEIERVLSLDAIRDWIDDWEGEAREVLVGDGVLGELLLKLKFSDKSEKHNKSKFISNFVSKNLFITPTDTIASLVEKNKFLPLKLDFVEDFPPKNKRLVLRKIV